jgi:hypothetical protein
MATPQQVFLSHFVHDEGVLAIARGRPNQLTYVAAPTDIGTGVDIFFGPAVRKAPGGAEKEDVLGTRALWVDVDDEQLPKTTLPPSMTVWSGHGWHLYWRLETFITDLALIEELNQILMRDCGPGGDSCWNVNRVLRVPGTENSKPPRASVELRETTGFTYSVEDFRVVEALDDRTKQKIFTGDQRGYRSRSERDWAVVAALVTAGASDELITHIFDYHAIGDKYRDKETPAKYFSHTLEQARAKVVPAAGKKPKAPKQKVDTTIQEREDGYWMTGQQERRISTFTIYPKVLLDGAQFEADDAIIADVTASGYTWHNITFTRGAFTSVARLDKECPVMAWQWLGSDNDVRKLLPYLLDRLREEGLPRVAATPVEGLHFVKGVPHFVGDKETMSPDGKWVGYEGPLAWLPSKREHPTVTLGEDISPAELERLGRLLPQVNEPGIVWVMTGWYAATCMKPWLKERNVRFPVLNVTGTRGSGKTTMIQRVFMPLFGQTDPKSYDAGTTRFVTLALMGGTNAIPIAFSEFRYESVEKFLRYILLAYDTGHDPRGRADQTTVDYPLSAPYSIDGEDMIADPAAQERIVVAQLNPATVSEGSDAYNAFQILQENIPEQFGGYYIRHCLRWMQDGTAEQLLKEARGAIFRAFPKKLPDRVRNNHIVAYFGILCFCKVLGLQPPEATVLDKSIRTVCNVETGRSRSLSDEFVEAVVNAVNQSVGSQYFKWQYDAEKGNLYFQVATSHTWWLTARRHSGRGGLERDAIKAQLKESVYAVAPGNRDGIWMHGVNLAKAQECGLDIPTELHIREIYVRL